jgi:hypothetical protein
MACEWCAGLGVYRSLCMGLRSLTEVETSRKVLTSGAGYAVPIYSLKMTNERFSTTEENPQP